MPNVNYNTEEQIEIYKNEKKNNILLIYQNKLIKYCDVIDFINMIVNIYNLEYNLFFILSIDTDDENFKDKYNIIII